jgi:hypothetical protein
VLYCALHASSHISAVSPVRRPAPSQVSSPHATLPAGRAPDRHLVCTVSTRSLAGAGVAGVSDGVAGGALFNAPTAAAYAPPGSLYAAGQQLANGGGTAGTLFVADTGNNRLRRVDLATGVVETLAGVGLPGSGGDGTALTAFFNAPRGVAVTANGTVFIAGALSWSLLTSTQRQAVLELTLMPSCSAV